MNNIAWCHYVDLARGCVAGSECADGAASMFRVSREAESSFTQLAAEASLRVCPVS